MEKRGNEAMMTLLAKLTADVATSATEGGSFWFPPQASTAASTIDDVYYFIYYISVFFFVLIGAAIVYLSLKYRRKSRDQKPVEAAGHSNTLELTWSIIPTLLCVVMFYMGAVGFMDLRVAPKDALEVNVKAWKWAWEFQYPNGGTSSELYVVKDRPVRLVMASDDVLHSFFVPSFRVKQDVVPGRYTTLWFEATMAGEHQIFCTEYCGTRHSDMLAKVVVLETQEEWDAKMKQVGNPYEGKSPAESGALVYKAKGCNACHSLDGSKVIGPSFKGIWGEEHAFTDGSKATVDENYVRESVLYPQKKVLEGFPPVMPTYQGRLSDDEIGFLIEYLKTLASGN